MGTMNDKGKMEYSPKELVALTQRLLSQWYQEERFEMGSDKILTEDDLLQSLAEFFAEKAGLDLAGMEQAMEEAQSKIERRLGDAQKAISDALGYAEDLKSLV